MNYSTWTKAWVVELCTSLIAVICCKLLCKSVLANRSERLNARLGVSVFYSNCEYLESINSFRTRIHCWDGKNDRDKTAQPVISLTS
jgi:hypothetical protein